MRNLLDPTPADLFGGHEVVRWYLKDSADHLDEAESRKEAAAAARLEKFMVRRPSPPARAPPRSSGRGEMAKASITLISSSSISLSWTSPAACGRRAAGVLHQDAGRYLAFAGGR